MANCLRNENIHVLQQFVNQSPWPFQELRASLARKGEREFVPEAYCLVEGVSFPKQRKRSVRVARQYCGTLGKAANCQVAVTLDLWSEESSTSLDWALYLPKQWIDDPVRRKKAGIPEEITFKTKPELLLDLIDEVRKWELRDRQVLADSFYGILYEFRQGLRSRKLGYVVQSSGDLMAWTEDPHPPEPPIKRGGKVPRKRHYAKELPPARSLCQIGKNLPSWRWETIAWGEGTKGPLSSRFARLIL
jgi:SRSO17 transposase